MRSSTPGPEASNIAHVKMRVLEASKTCQQISNGSDVLEFVMNELTHGLGTVTLWGSEAMWRKLFRSSETACYRKTSRFLSEYDNSMSWGN